MLMDRPFDRRSEPKGNDGIELKSSDRGSGGLADKSKLNFNKVDQNDAIDKSIEIKKGVFLKSKDYNIPIYEPPAISLPINLDVRKTKLIWFGFPLAERFWHLLCCKATFTTNLSTKNYPIDDFLKNPAEVDKNISFLNKILYLKINKTGNLAIENNTLHPFIKVSFIDLRTLSYLQKLNPTESCITRRESLLKIQHSRDSNYGFKYSELDFIPPVSTSPYDLRDKGEPFAEWKEEFIINEDASNVFINSTVIFFELFDYDFKADLRSGADSFLVPIAWGYLKPCGYSQTYLGKMKIQLYKYKYKRPAKHSAERNKGWELPRTPDVVFEFNYFKREMYQTYLEVELHLENKPDDYDLQHPKYSTLWKYKTSVFYNEGDETTVLLNKEETKKLEDVKITRNSDLVKIMRRKEDPCIIPNKLYMKLPTAKLGCLTLKFSPNGKYIACACTSIHSTTTIKIFNVLEKELRYHFKGHSELIHHFEWSFNSRVLISSSADFKVKLWRIPMHETSNQENLEFLDNEAHFLLATLNHPNYVYSTAIVRISMSSDGFNFYLSTASADGVFRVWRFELENEDVNSNLYILRKQLFCYEYSIRDEFISKDLSRYNDDSLKNKVKSKLSGLIIKSKDTKYVFNLAKT